MVLELLKKFWKPVLGLVVLVGLAFGARSYYRLHQSEERLAAAQVAHQEALKEAALGKEALAALPGLQSQRDVLLHERDTLKGQIGDLEAELGRRPLPPAAGKPPTELVQVLADLTTMGIHPAPLSTPQFSLLNGDAPVVWSWGKESLRVPGLEARLSTTTQLKDKLKLDADNLGKDLALADQQKAAAVSSATHFENAFNQEASGATQLRLELKSTTAERDSARRTRIYVGLGGVGLGGYLTYKLIKK